MRKLEVIFSDNPNLSINSNLRRIQFAFIAGVSHESSSAGVVDDVTLEGVGSEADPYKIKDGYLADVATTGSYNDLRNKPTIPAAQIQSDWNQTNDTALDYIKNKPTITPGLTEAQVKSISKKQALKYG